MSHRRPVKRSGGMNRRAFLYGAVVATGAGIVTWQLWPGGSGSAGASGVTIDSIGDQVQTLPRGQLPAFASTADVQRLYRYAVEHPDELKYMPCFCGCYRFGHKSNYDCYIKAERAEGTVTFTSHAAT
jgi:hypothetical protein